MSALSESIKTQIKFRRGTVSAVVLHHGLWRILSALYPDIRRFERELTATVSRLLSRERAVPMASNGRGHEDLLDSWKEISVFLKRGVRTVQRWERTQRLPVHHRDGKRGGVFAFVSEIEQWMRSRDGRGSYVALDYRQLGQVCEAARSRAEKARTHVDVASAKLTGQIERLIANARILSRRPAA